MAGQPSWDFLALSSRVLEYGPITTVMVSDTDMLTDHCQQVRWRAADTLGRMVSNKLEEWKGGGVCSEENHFGP